MNNQVEYSVIIPVYNSQDSLRELHERLVKVFEELANDKSLQEFNMSSEEVMSMIADPKLIETRLGPVFKRLILRIHKKIKKGEISIVKLHDELSNIAGKLGVNDVTLDEFKDKIVKFSHMGKEQSGRIVGCFIKHEEPNFLILQTQVGVIRFLEKPACETFIREVDGVRGVPVGKGKRKLMMKTSGRINSMADTHKIVVKGA